MVYYSGLPEIIRIENRFQIHDKNIDGYVNTEELAEMMRTYLWKHDNVMTKGIVKKNRIENFDTKIILSGSLIVEFVGATTSRWLYGYRHI